MPDLILYGTRPDGSFENLADTLREAHPDIHLHQSIDIRDLSKRLRRPQSRLLAVICMAANARDLQMLSEIRDFLTGLNLILILPDQDPAVLSHGLKLFPRYVAYENHGLSDVLLVVDKMKKNALSANRFGVVRTQSLQDAMERR